MVTPSRSFELDLKTYPLVPNWTKMSINLCDKLIRHSWILPLTNCMV